MIYLHFDSYSGKSLHHFVAETSTNETKKKRVEQNTDTKSLNNNVGTKKNQMFVSIPIFVYIELSGLSVVVQVVYEFPKTGG